MHDDAHPNPALIERLNQPMNVGGKTVANRLWLAPMVGLTHVAYRQVLDSYGGCGLMFTEMCSAKGLPRDNRNVSSVFRWRDEELPRLVCQIMGMEPDEMALAARRVEDEGFFGVDINMGCSAPGVVKRGGGAALLKEASTAAGIVEAVRKAVDCPVLVKFRTGWKADGKLAASMAQTLESAGADALVFHPRVAPDKRSRPPVMSHITDVAEAVSIPVMGNGNVCTPHDCEKMLDMTGCDGVSVGRMAMAKPWLFARWTQGDFPDNEPYLDYALALLDALDEHFEPVRAVKLYKQAIVYLAANFTYGHRVMRSLIAGKTTNELRESARTTLSEDLQESARPSALLFND